MNPAEFLAVAVMLSVRGDLRLMEQAQRQVDTAKTQESREYWAAYRDEDAVRAGGKLAVWLEAKP